MPTIRIWYSSERVLPKGADVAAEIRVLERAFGKPVAKWEVIAPDAHAHVWVNKVCKNCACDIDTATPTCTNDRKAMPKNLF